MAEATTTEKARAAATAQTVAQIKAIEAEGGEERERLARIRDALVRLGAQTELFPEEDFPAPEDGKGDRLFRLWMEPDETYALYLNRGTGAKDTPPHNHTTWACVVGVRGQEHNKFYRRTDDRSEPGRGTVELVEEKTVERGTGVAMTGDDIHSMTATELFGEVNRETRARAKTINFAILYGISRWGLAGRLDVTADEAQAMIDRYFERFPGINRYIAETLTTAKERGYTTTLFGRKTHFPRLKSKNQNERAGSERAAINAPIQGTSADIIKRAMVRMGPALAEAGLPDVKMLMQVHDELVFELPKGDVDAAKAVIERVMANAAEPAITLTVPLGVEIGTGESWGAAH